MSDKYRPAPYNYCDYRCDRCEHKEQCKVYKDGQERLIDHFVKGEDPYDPEIFLNDIKQIFARTKDMLRDLAKKEDIDIREVPDEEEAEVNPEEYVIYRLAREYFKEAYVLIKELENKGVPEEIEEEYADLVWYHTLIVAKAGRLVSGYIDDLLDEEIRKIEEDGTLGVIKKAVSMSKNALQKMLNKLPDYFYNIVDLMDLLKRIETQIRTDIHKKVAEDSP